MADPFLADQKQEVDDDEGFTNEELVDLCADTGAKRRLNSFHFRCRVSGLLSCKPTLSLSRQLGYFYPKHWFLLY